MVFADEMQLIYDVLLLMLTQRGRSCEPYQSQERQPRFRSLHLDLRREGRRRECESRPKERASTSRYSIRFSRVAAYVQRRVPSHGVDQECAARNNTYHYGQERESFLSWLLVAPFSANLVLQYRYNNTLPNSLLPRARLPLRIASMLLCCEKRESKTIKQEE